jgi:CBS domain-containing protein
LFDLDSRWSPGLPSIPDFGTPSHLNLPGSLEVKNQRNPPNRTHNKFLSNGHLHIDKEGMPSCALRSSDGKVDLDTPQLMSGYAHNFRTRNLPRTEISQNIGTITSAMTLREILHAHIPVLTANSTFRDAVDKMDIYQFPGLVIVDIDQKPIAVVTEGDLCRAVDLNSGLMKLSDQPALDFATPNPTCCGVDVEVSDALHQMLANGTTILPVVQEERLVGMVLRVDLMQAMLMDQSSPQMRTESNQGS